MAEYVGQNDSETGELISVGFWPTLQVVDFQSRFNNLKEIDIEVVTIALFDATDKVTHHLKSVKANFETFFDFVGQHELTNNAVYRLYARSVHNFAMADVLSSSITTSDTKHAEDRESNLQERINMHESEARQAISMLLSQPTLMAKVV
jgi:hypothetical protein